MASSAIQVPLSAVAARKALREAEAAAAAALEEKRAADKPRKKKKRRQADEDELTAGTTASAKSLASAAASASADGGKSPRKRRQEGTSTRLASSTVAKVVDDEERDEVEEGEDATSPPTESDLEEEQDRRRSPQKQKAAGGRRPIPTRTSSFRRTEQPGDDDEGRPLDPPTPIFQPIWKGENTNVALVRGPSSQSAAHVVLALPRGQAMAFRGIVQVRVLHGAVVVQGAVLTPRSATAILLAPARHACPAPIAVEPSDGTPSDLAVDLRPLLPGSTSDCCILELSQAPEDVRSIEHFGRVFPVPGEEVPFGFKAGTDLLFEAGVPSLPGFRLIGGATMGIWSAESNGGMHALKVDVVELPPSWISAVQTAVPDFVQSSIPSSAKPAVESVATPLSCGLVRGPRGVGKSLFARTLLNAAITAKDAEWSAVAFLDLDLGQTEFGPPGVLSLNIFNTATSSSASPLLIGPPWTTLRQPVRSHFVGDTTPKNVPRAYLEAARDLVRFYQHHVASGYVPSDDSDVHLQSSSSELNGNDAFESRSRKRRRLGVLPETSTNGDASLSNTPFIPLIVNTQGWVSGLGADLLSEIQSLLQPTHIFDFTPQIPAQHQDQELAERDTFMRLGAIAAPPSESTKDKADTPPPPRVVFVPASTAAVGPAAQSRLRLTAVDQRALMLLSYLHAESLPSYSLKADRFAPTWNFDLPLTALPPLVVNVTDGLLGGIHVLPFGAAVDEKLRLHALNGAVVALVEQQVTGFGITMIGDDGADTERNIASTASGNAREAWLQSFRKPIPLPPTSRCIGLAVVRSISRDRQELHLLGPMQAALAHQRGSSRVRSLALVKGAIDLPAQGALDFESIEYLRRPHLLQASSARLEGRGDEGGQSDDEEEPDQDGTGGAVVTLCGRTIHGVPVERIPYLEWPSDDVVTVAGGKKRRVRRNLQRRAH